MSEIIIDENLIARMACRDAAAFRELYLASSSVVYGYALSILKSKADAEDVMHDAFIRIYQGASSYQPKGKPLAWMLTIVRNLCYNAIRQQKSTAVIEEDKSLSFASHEQASVDRIVLEKALQILDSQERQIVILHALTGMKHREIAGLLELPTGTVLSKYHRALNKLREEINGRSS